MSALFYLVSGLYLLTGIVMFAGYLPTIVELLRGRPSASIGTWSMWTAGNIATVLYGVVILRDIPFLLLSSLDLLLGLLILGLRIRLDFVGEKS